MRNLLLFLLAGALMSAQPASGPATNDPNAGVGYVLGPGDQLGISVVNLNEDFTSKTFRIDMRGDVNLPLAGRFHAAGLTINELEDQVQQRLVRYVKDPQVVATVTEFNSQPVSVLGAVNIAGVKQVQGHRTLFEVLSLAGGLRPDAGSTIKITRKLEQGAIPLPDAETDPSGKFSVGSVSVKTILNATDPAENIVILPGDIISVSKADVIYAVGSVIKPGGFPLNQDASLSALQVLSLAGGLTPTAALDRAQILRTAVGSDNPLEIPVNLKQIMVGKAPDLPLRPNDILFVPNSTSKVAAFKAIDVLSMAAVYGRVF